MEPITSETILILAGSFLCVFISLVTLGGSFLYWRTRQINNSPLPEPTPPVVTRDVHAKPLGETPTKDEPTRNQNPVRRAVPVGQAAAAQGHVSAVSSAPDPPTIQDTHAPHTLRAPLGADLLPSEKTEAMSFEPPPLGLDLDLPNDDDDDDDGSETVTRELTRPNVKHIELPKSTDNDTTPTVIIDRNQPKYDNDEEGP